jgi:hypothetical protein
VALASPVCTFEIDLADANRSIYESLALRAERLGAAALLILAASACSNGSPNGDLPTIQTPLDYVTVHVDLPGCEVRLPPVHDVARCSPDDIGKRIPAGEVCNLLVGLHDWAGASRWSLARSSCVSDTIAHWPHRAGQPPRRVLTLYVEVPEKSEVWFAQQTAGQPIEYFVSPNERKR